jgi:hypothetical protein
MQLLTNTETKCSTIQAGNGRSSTHYLGQSPGFCQGDNMDVECMLKNNDENANDENANESWVGHKITFLRGPSSRPPLT